MSLWHYTSPYLSFPTFIARVPPWGLVQKLLSTNRWTQRLPLSLEHLPLLKRKTSKGSSCAIMMKGRLGIKRVEQTILWSFWFSWLLKTPSGVIQPLNVSVRPFPATAIGGKVLVFVIWSPRFSVSQAASINTAVWGADAGPQFAVWTG